MGVQERVARGARWLDEVSPGWRDAMALRTFDLANGCQCVLGQVFAEAAAPAGSGYDYALSNFVTRDELVACPEWPAAHGFTLEHPGARWSQESLQLQAAEWAALEAEWSSVIHGRRDQLTSGVRC
jgi:hypothetical protein